MVNLRPVKTEINLVSEKYQFGATPDCVGVVIDKLASSRLEDRRRNLSDMLIQLAAYRTAWEENFPDQPLEGGFHLLRIGKEDASFHHHHWGHCPRHGKCSAIFWRSTSWRKPSRGRLNGNRRS